MVFGAKAESEIARKAGRRSGALWVETLGNIQDSAQLHDSSIQIKFKRGAILNGVWDEGRVNLRLRGF